MKILVDWLLICDIMIVSIHIGYHMRGEVISVLSLEGRYNVITCLPHTSALITVKKLSIF